MSISKTCKRTLSSSTFPPLLRGLKLIYYSVAFGSALKSELGVITFLLGTLGVKPFSRVVSAVERFRSYSMQSFKRYEQHVAMNPTNPKPTLFTKMIQKVDKGESLESQALIREGKTDSIFGVLLDTLTSFEGQGFIIAGSDTTANTMTYLVYGVTRNPEVRDKLVAEVSTLPSDFGWDHVRNLPYLNNCIEEALRLYGAAPGALPRSVPHGGAYLAGYHFPEGFTVSTQSYTLHRNPSIFKDPER